MIVGIPRALLYYQYLALWKTFFQEMGCEVVLSSYTNKTILSGGTSRVVAETCLPVKAYCGHVMDLREKCDFIFIPALKRTEKDATNCSKFLGLPDMIKAVVPRCPPTFEIDIDVNKGNRDTYQQIYALGRNFTWNPLKVRSAFIKSWQAHKDYINLMRTQGRSMPQVLPEIEKSCRHSEQNTVGQASRLPNRSTGTVDLPETESEGQASRLPIQQQTVDRIQNTGSAGAIKREPVSLALIGHPYMLYDDFINHSLRERLKKMGVTLYTPEMVSKADMQKAISKLVGKTYWGYEDEIVGAGGHYLDSQLDGVIAVVAFGCGPDSLMIDVVARYAREKAKKPFLNLTFDEHTGEAGILTRLEAFVDMIRRRKASGLWQTQPVGQASRLSRLVREEALQFY